jgi:cytidyltransferase-like protein
MTSNFIDISDLKKRKDFILGYGHFTTIHPGHIRYLKHAKSLGNTLIIALKGDGDLDNQESKYQFNQGERAEALALLDIADFLILLKDDEIDEIVKATNPKLLILGKQFEKSPEEKVQRAIQFLSKRGISTFWRRC